ncbi:coiled-coil domain-containing protein [Allopseudospirillum japonicum]|nr:hypothetical protein [Allopseudospirillum japonicum]
MNKTINSHQPRTARRALLGVALSLVLAQGALMPTSFANPVDLSLQAKSLQQGLHQLSNQDLLTQASQSYQQALAQFNAERRLLLQHQSLYQQTQAANADWQMPEPLAPTGLEVDEAVLTRAEAHIQSYQAREQSLLQERTILENYLRQYDASLQATEHFLATLQELQVAILELSLRIQDGSLQPGQRPLYLTQAAITQRARTLETEQAALQERQAQSRQQLQNLQQNLETIQASLASTQTQLTQMRNQLEEQNRQHALQENYRKQDNQALAESFAQLEDERVFLQGDFQLLLLRFNQGYEQLTPLAQALEAPVDTIEAPGTGLGVAELETQIAALQTQIEALEQRLQELQPYQQQQEKFVEQGEAFKVSASFLQKQLAQMQMLIRIAAERQLPLAQELDQATLEDQRARIDQQVQEANAKLEVAQTQVLALKTRLEEIKSAHQQANQLLADLQQSLASSKQAQQWEQEVLSLDSQALIDHFVKGVQAVGDQQAALQAQQQDVTQAQADIRALID